MNRGSQGRGRDSVGQTLDANLTELGLLRRPMPHAIWARNLTPKDPVFLYNVETNLQTCCVYAILKLATLNPGAQVKLSLYHARQVLHQIRTHSPIALLGHASTEVSSSSLAYTRKLPCGICSIHVVTVQALFAEAQIREELVQGGLHTVHVA